MSLIRYAAASKRAAQGETRALSFGFALLCLALGGCHHRQAPPTLPAVLKVPDVPPPSPAPPAMETPPPATITDVPPSVKVTEAKPKRRPKKISTKQSAEPAPAPAEIVAVKPPQSLGELSAGGESNSKNQQDANELITSGERRIDTLSKTSVAQQEPQVREVRRFLQQARQALGTGDVEGARTLATKAKLLMDDLEKWSQQP